MYLTITDEQGDDISIPAVYSVCPTCDGHGAHSRGVERDGGGFTASEWAEEDQDFREDYMSGAYDRTCEECDGQRVILVPDFDAMTEEHKRAFEAHANELADCRAIERAERAFGC